MVAAITALALMNNMRSLPDAKRKALIVMAAFVLGGGIWSMHFLAMLSLQFTAPIHYDLLQTLGSGLIAVLVVGAALLLLHFRPRTRAILNLAGVSLGIGIVAMHFIGMLGMRGVIPTFNGIAVVASVIVAPVMGVAAIRVSYGARSRQNIVKGGIVFGLSVVVVHFTAMIGVHFSIDPNYSQLTVAIDQAVLAIAVTVAVFVICGAFLLAASTFVSSDPSDGDAVPGFRAETDAMPVVTSGHGVELLPSHSENPETGAGQIVGVSLAESLATEFEADKGENLTSSADGDLAERQRLRPEKTVEDLPEKRNGVSTGEIQSEKDDEKEQLADGIERRPEQTPSASLPVRIPFEELKEIAFVSSDEVGALRADGRYTQIYSQLGVKLCPWSISEAEKRLASVGFFRSHRSYLINIAKVDGFEKKREAGVCRFSQFANLGSVPVSRTRVAEVVKRLGL